MRQAAALHRTSFDDRLPWLAGLHTPDEDATFFVEFVYAQCEVQGAFEGQKLVGFIAFREGWIDQFYVDPGSQDRGVGSTLLSIAKSAFPLLELWTFQRNTAAIGFYCKRGFVEVERTDGARNEEREHDVRLSWRADET